MTHEVFLNRVHFGDCLDTLKTMPDGIVNTCVTSPPYYGLRDYGHAGQIGLEATPDVFVQKLVAVFREVRRVLRDDGTLWVNMGDSYAGSGKGGNPEAGKQATNRGSQTVGVLYETGKTAREAAVTNVTRKTFDDAGIKAKDLIGVPWMLAFALRADGWYLRQDIIWAKPNPMPESVTDRCTKAHEYIFLLSKSARYFCDMESIKEPAIADHAPGNNSHKGATAYEEQEGEFHRTKAGLVAYAQRQRRSNDGKADSDLLHDGEHLLFCGEPDGVPANVGRGGKNAFRGQGHFREAESGPANRDGRDMQSIGVGDKRNKRTVWTVSTKPYSGAHFATFPPDLIEPCILAGSPAGGVVLDPFFGSGTTGEVAQRLGRNWIGCELNPDYEPLQRERIAGGTPGFAFA